jgi:hypothetical protein
MTLPVRRDDGSIVVPHRAEGPRGLIGDGAKVVWPTDPDFKKWDDWLRRNGK